MDSERSFGFDTHLLMRVPPLEVRDQLQICTRMRAFLNQKDKHFKMTRSTDGGGKEHYQVQLRPEQEVEPFFEYPRGRLHVDLNTATGLITRYTGLTPTLDSAADLVELSINRRIAQLAQQSHPDTKDAQDEKVSRRRLLVLWLAWSATGIIVVRTGRYCNQRRPHE